MYNELVGFVFSNKLLPKNNTPVRKTKTPATVKAGLYIKEKIFLVIIQDLLEFLVSKKVLEI
jgi:hypothetical protein